MGRAPEVAPARGFTLLEVVVTLLVIGVAVALAAPVVGRSAETLQARADVAGFSATLRHARERAITSRKRHVVAVDPDAHRLTIAAEGEEARATRSLPSRLTVQAAAGAGLSVRFEPQGHGSGGQFRLTSGGLTYRVTVDPITGRVRSARE